MAKKKKTKKKPTKKAAAKKRPAKSSKATAKKSTSKSKSGNNSVDGLLRKFQKERLTQETQLAATKKKIGELEAKTAAFQEQIKKLTDKAKTSEQTIASLDAKRDQEVSELLGKLGVQLTGQPSSSTPPSQAPQKKPDNFGTSVGDRLNEALQASNKPQS